MQKQTENIKMLAIVINIWLAAMVLSQDWITKVIILGVVMIYAVIFMALVRQDLGGYFNEPKRNHEQDSDSVEDKPRFFPDE
jgi:hypothetical protein